MDGAGVVIAIFVTIGIVLISIIACGSICCCCCAIPIFRIIWNMFFPPKPTYQVNAVQSGNSRREYELVNSSSVESGGYQHRFGFSEPLHEDVVMAEAYLVPPLAEVVAVNNSSNTEAPPTEEDANRIHELQVLTNENKEGGFRDSWAAVLFIANVLIIIYLFVQSIYLLKSENSTGTTAEEQESTYDLGLIRTIAAFIVLLTVIAAGLGSFVLSVLIQHSENLIEMVMWSNIAIQGFCAIMCLLSLQIIGAVIFGVLAGLNYWYLMSVRSQIPFSSTVLATACTAVKENYTGLLTTAFSALFVQMLWGLVWIIAVVGVLYATQDTDTPTTTRYLSSAVSTTGSTAELNLQSKHSDDYHYSDDDSDESSLRGLYMFLLFVSLYWGVQVTKAVVQTTVAGTLACWWFQPQREAPVRGSLLRAMTTSFGSLCLGSLIVAILQAIREMIQAMRRQALNRRDERERSFLLECFLSIANILLEWIEMAVQYFNKYAYCYVAAYGLSFLQSGRLVTGLFTSRGWTAIINDNLISNALTCGVIALGVATMVCGVLLSFLFDLAVASNIGDMGTLALIGGITGLVAGLIVGMVLTNALDSAVAMVFVCFAESPQALQKNHPEVYADLRSKWDAMYPSSLTWLGTESCLVPTAHSSAGGTAGYHAPQQNAYAYSGDYSTHNAYNPSTSPPYNAGYSGYGGYGAAAGSGGGYQAQSSPGSAVYNPHYQPYPPPHQQQSAGYQPAVGYAAAVAPIPYASAPSASAVAHPVSTAAGNGHTAVYGGKNLPPSAPPGGY